MSAIDLGAIRALNLPKVGQIGFVVRSIDRTLPYYSAFFNVDTWYEPRYAEKRHQYKGEETDYDERLVIAFSGKTQIELIEPKEEDHPYYAPFLREHGDGLHHLGFIVSDFDEKLRTMERLGIQTLMSGRFKTAGGGLARFAHLDTRELCGVILEIIEITLYGIRVPQTAFMWNISAITGDVVKIRA